MAKEYVEQREGGYYVLGSRVSLDSVVYAFLRGESPEGIADSFPALSLEQVFLAVLFYLAHQERIDAYLQEGKAEFARMREEETRLRLDSSRYAVFAENFRASPALRS